MPSSGRDANRVAGLVATTNASPNRDEVILWADPDTHRLLTNSTITGTITVDSELPAAAALADNSATPTVPSVGAFGMLYDGATWDMARATSPTLATGNAGVMAVGLHVADGASIRGLGTNSTVGDGNNGLAGLLTGTQVYNGSTWDRMRGDVANGVDVDVTRLPELPAGTNAIGKLATNDGVDIGDVTLNNTTSNAVPTKGVPSDIDINGSNANHADKYYTSTGAVTDGIVWSPAAGKRWHILTLYINVSAAATVTLEDDLAAGDSTRWKAELAANSGVVLKYDKEHPFCSGENAADLLVTTTAGNVYIQAVGYEV